MLSAKRYDCTYRSRDLGNEQVPGLFYVSAMVIDLWLNGFLVGDEAKPRGRYNLRLACLGRCPKDDKERANTFSSNQGSTPA